MWKDWLAFSRNEQYGIIFLSVFTVLFLIMRLVLPVVWNNEVERVDDIDHYFEITDKPASSDMAVSNPEDKAEKYNLKPFNPNRITVTNLYDMGLSSYVIVNWMKFLEAGGRFYKPEDVGKIYGIDSLLVLRLEKFVDFEDNNDSYQSKTLYSGIDKDRTSYESESNKADSHRYSDNSEDDGISGFSSSRILASQSFSPININKATVEDFQQLRGIGEVYSSRIIAFRELLGGFYQIEQMSEVYGISEELFTDIKSHLTIEDGPSQKIDVNRASLRQLRNHPYVNFYQARDIVMYRKEHGLIENLKVLRSFSSFDEVSLEKVLPYFSFNVVETENEQKIQN